MKKSLIYKKIRESAPVGIFSEPEWLEALEQTPLPELLQDLDDLYTSWGKITQLPSAYTEEEIKKVQEHESLFDFILHAIFSYGDPSVIPQLLKYVPSDEEYEDEDLVFLEDYSREPLCNGITEADYFGEAYIPVLLSHIHELLPKKIRAADSFLYDMVLDDLNKFKDHHPLFNNFHLVRKEPFIQLLNFALNSVLEETSREQKISLEKIRERIEEPISSITYKDEPLIKVAYLRQEFLRLHAAD